MLLRQYTHSPVCHGVGTVLLILVKTLFECERKKLTNIFQLRYPQKTVSSLAFRSLKMRPLFYLEKWTPIIVVMRRV